MPPAARKLEPIRRDVARMAAEGLRVLAVAKGVYAGAELAGEPA